MCGNTASETLHSKRHSDRLGTERNGVGTLSKTGYQIHPSQSRLFRQQQVTLHLPPPSWSNDLCIFKFYQVLFFFRWISRSSRRTKSFLGVGCSQTQRTVGLNFLKNFEIWGNRNKDSLWILYNVTRSDRIPRRAVGQRALHSAAGTSVPRAREIFLCLLGSVHQSFKLDHELFILCEKIHINLI